MTKDVVNVGDCSIEVLRDGEAFVGLGAIQIGEVLVRSGRLPLGPVTQTFTGLELAGLRLVGVETEGDGVRIATEATFRPLPVKLMRDHSFDPIHETGDWDAEATVTGGRLDLVLRPAADEFDGTRFTGFRYHYEYAGRDVPLFYLLDRASWELDGDVVGATVISQSSCSPPVATFGSDTAWTTEGVFHFEGQDSRGNPVMTHNLPRWASHQAFDFQYKGGRTLIGVFERVDLIRTLLKREPGKPELKCFDKHIFDEAARHATTPKKILLNVEGKTDTGQRNLWTRIFDEVHGQARAEFGLAEEPLVPLIHCNFWDNFTFEDYRTDLLPVAKALGFEMVFIDNVHKSAMSERCPHPDWHWNMCCGHEYEVADRLGGPARLKALVADFKAAGVRVLSWTNNDQAHSSPLNKAERADEDSWYVTIEDARQKYGGAYLGCMSVLNFRKDAPRESWVACLKKTKAQTGLDCWLFDSFYNLGFMPVDFSGCRPTTQWRQIVEAFRQLQQAGIRMHIESFGPWGVPFHGCPGEYALPENLFATYKVYAQIGYTTVPSGDAEVVDDREMVYRFFAHMASPLFTLRQGGKRLDETWSDGHRQALADYNRSREFMHKRFLQEDGRSVLWHDAAGERATIWNFAEREAALPGEVADLTAGRTLPKADRYKLEPFHTYAAMGVEPLPVEVSG